MKNNNIDIYKYSFLSLTTIGLLYFYFNLYYFHINYLLPKNLSIFQTDYFKDLLIIIYVISGPIVFPFIFYNKIKLFLKKFLIINFSFFIVIFINSENILNYLTKVYYENINNDILSLNSNENNVKNTILYQKFLEDKTNNDVNKLIKYTSLINEKPIYQSIINKKLIAANLNQKQHINYLLEKNHSNSKVLEKINLIKQDNFISLYEYLDFKNYIDNI